MNRIANFSMADMQTLWENGGQTAYFASYGGTTAQPNPGRAMPPPNNMPNNMPNLKAQEVVRVTNDKGLTFLQRRWKNVTDAGKGAMKYGSGGLTNVANVASKGVKATGSGAILAGMKVRELGGAIAANPRVAGAVILGGTALGAGGAYAYNRRNKN